MNKKKKEKRKRKKVQPVKHQIITVMQTDKQEEIPINLV